MAFLNKHSDYFSQIPYKLPKTIPTNMKVDLVAMFHKIIKLSTSDILFDYKVLGLIPNWPRPHKMYLLNFFFVSMNVCNVML